MIRLWFAGLIVGLVALVVPTAEAAEGVPLQDIVDATPSGGVVTLDAAVYTGPVTIDKPVTLRGVEGTVIDGEGIGNVIEVNASGVTIEGVVIRNSGDRLDKEHAGVSADDADGLRVVDNVFEDVLFGMFIRSSRDVAVVGNVIGSKDLFVARRGDGIRLWQSSGALIEGNEIGDGRDTVFWFTDDITVRDNSISNGRYGLHFMYSDNAVVEGNLITDNSVGAFLMYSTNLTVRRNTVVDSRGPSGYGLGLKDMDGVEVSGNRFEGNRIGLYLDNSPSRVDMNHTVLNNVFAFNDTGVMFRPSVKRNSFSENAFIDNTEHVSIDGGGQIDENVWTIAGIGNHWSDYAGYDADDDGVGDLPYRLDDLFSDLTDRHPELRFLLGTPAARAIDMAGEAFPNLRPEPKLIDTAPLVSTPDFPEAPSARGEPSRLTVLAASAILLLVAGAIVAAARPRGIGRVA
ncbi:MAG: nitrous oxide reductase family maturation protein NosD [Actinomycetia bacterium]|nr:nitrous oxide reductase family maturation protein NosD [Actinomycetes bacterium]MCP4960430.1 nitrous oxide reductase family maturation protein NosD [Actinomycetes bacterium]